MESHHDSLPPLPLTNPVPPMPSTFVSETPRIARSTTVPTYRKDRLRSFLVITWLLCAGGALVSGLDYYLLPTGDRASHPDYYLFRPGGAIGEGFGVLGGLLLAAGVFMYSARKRLFWLKRTATMRSWLFVHIFLCSLGAFLIVLHAGLRVGGSASVLFWGLMVVLSSGVAGRFLYQWIPKTPHGRFLMVSELEDRRADLRDELRRVSGSSEAQADIWLGDPIAIEEPSLARAVSVSMRYNLTRRFRRSRLTQTLKHAGLKGRRNADSVRTIMSEHRLQVQAALLEPFKELFSRWHRLHLWLSAAFGIVLVGHVLWEALLP